MYYKLELTMYYRLELTMYYCCLWYDKLWGPSQRVVTLLFFLSIWPRSTGAELCLMTKWATLDEDGDDVDGDDDGEGSHDGTEDHGDDDDIV